MIIATINVKIPPERKQEIQKTISMLSSSIRNEPGCRSCGLYLDAESVDAVLMVQEWTTQQDFVRHVRANSFSTLLGALTLTSERPRVRILTGMHAGGMELISAVRAA